MTTSRETGRVEDHTSCPGSWCSTIACDICGEMLTNPKPQSDGFVGICPGTHGRGVKGVLLRRADCLYQPEASDSGGDA